MIIESIVSTMHIKNMHNFKEAISRMNLQDPFLFINQCPNDNFPLLNIEKGNKRIVSVSEKGLSNSRNLAISLCQGDIYIISDDDLVYESNYKKQVESAFLENPDVDIIAFYVEGAKKKDILKEGRVGFFGCLKLCSVQLAVKIDSLRKKNISFDNRFGSGSGCYISGEESIFLFDCLKNGLHIYYMPLKIGTLISSNSTWFKGYNKEFFITKGACYYRMSHFLSFFLILQFVIRKKKLYKDEMSFCDALHYMLIGAKEQKNYEKRKRSKK